MPHTPTHEALPPVDVLLRNIMRILGQTGSGGGGLDPDHPLSSPANPAVINAFANALQQDFPQDVGAALSQFAASLQQAVQDVPGTMEALGFGGEGLGSQGGLGVQPSIVPPAEPSPPQQSQPDPPPAPKPKPRREFPTPKPIRKRGGPKRLIR